MENLTVLKIYEVHWDSDKDQNKCLFEWFFIKMLQFNMTVIGALNQAWTQNFLGH